MNRVNRDMQKVADEFAPTLGITDGRFEYRGKHKCFVFTYKGKQRQLWISKSPSSDSHAHFLRNDLRRVVKGTL